MKAVILAGGLGSRISEETYLRPKPMVTIGEKPILWHIMMKFSSHNIKDFVICLGYKGEVIKDYFRNYKIYNSNFTTSISTGQFNLLDSPIEDWQVTLIDTGSQSRTGERLKRVKEYLSDEEFFFTYGDGLTDQNLNDTYASHLKSGKMVTLTAVIPPARYGAVVIDSGNVSKFAEKSSSPESLINGGYFIVNRRIFDLLENFENPSWEDDILPELTKRSDLSAFRHQGFWFAMDTLRDKEHLETLWERGDAPWST